jgi:hypothetical protein
VTDPARNALIEDVARDVLAETAPQELPLFRATSSAYFSDPQRATASAAAKDDALGFGVGDAVLFTTPIVLAVTSEVVTYLVGQVTKAAHLETSGVIEDVVRGMFRRFRKEPAAAAARTPPSTALSSRQLADVRRLAYEKARALKLDEAKAALLADSLAGSLATS